MRPRAIQPASLRLTLALTLAIAGCNGGPAPSGPVGSGGASPPSTGNCRGDLPLRTSPIDVPVAVLFVNGEDLPPVVGEVEWRGDGEPVAYEPARAIHLERFTVLQTEGQAEVSMRMSDGVEIAAWTVDAVPVSRFRGGDFETDRQRWSEGQGESTDQVCIPLSNGSWGVIATVTFADDAGSGTFYWRLIVTEVPGA